MLESEQMRVWTSERSAVAVALAVLLMPAACAADGSLGTEHNKPAPPTLSAPTASPEDPAKDTKRAVLEAYRGMWAAYNAAGAPPEADPTDHRLERYATGNALQRLVNGLASMKDDGLVIDGQALLYPDVTSLVPEAAPTQAQVEDCADSTNSLLVRADGQPYEDEPGGRRRIVADLEKSNDGVWRVVDFAVLEVGSCSA